MVFFLEEERKREKKGRGDLFASQLLNLDNASSANL